MKPNKRDLQVFNLSFLDVVSCGFGAVIMLVLISHTSDYRADPGSSEAASLLKTASATFGSKTEANCVLSFNAAVPCPLFWKLDRDI